jgi:hypothetical protein
MDKANNFLLGKIKGVFMSYKARAGRTLSHFLVDPQTLIDLSPSLRNVIAVAPKCFVFDNATC